MSRSVFHPPRSLKSRLALWYALSAMAIVFSSTLYLYWSFSRSLAQRDAEVLQDRLESLKVLLSEDPGNYRAVRERIESEWPGRRSETIFARVIDERGNTITQTPDSAEFFAKAEDLLNASRAWDVTEILHTDRFSFRGLGAEIRPSGEPRRRYLVELALDRSKEDDALEAYRLRLAGVLMLALVLCALVGHQLARLSDSLERLHRFSADIAHELRTPLNNLAGGLEVSLGQARTAEFYQEAIGSALEESRQLSSIIDSLLFLARAENPRMQLAREKVSVGRELGAVFEFYEPSAAERGISCSLLVEEEVVVSVEKTLFHRAVGNLLSNAIKHTGPSGTIEVHAYRREAKVHVEVRDTGVGISTEHLPHLVERFYRVDKSRNRGSGGTGLGLAIVKSIAAIHGGTVDIASELGKGTRVRLSLPAISA